jgi:pimeloyl-ACP methyl ester carboxylesterase
MPSLTINSKSLFYTIDEPPLGTAKSTTLFIHGLGSSSCFYKTITPSLKAFIRCISLDTPGSGLSSLGISEQSISSIAQDAINLLDALEVNEKVLVVGHSMGGIVANYIAAEYQERVKAVILLGPVNPAPGMADVFAKRIEVVRKGYLIFFLLVGIDGLLLIRWPWTTCQFHSFSSNRIKSWISPTRFHSVSYPRDFT